MMDSYDDNGDMIAEAGQKFRRVAWQINGGDRDGDIVKDADLEEALKQPHGGYSPVYVEVER
jgi:hypothetical protein